MRWRRGPRRVAGIADLSQAVPVPKGVPWYPDDVEAWSVRWVLLHLIEETARHAGHADIVGESIDGATMYLLMAALKDGPRPIGSSPGSRLRNWSRTARSRIGDHGVPTRRYGMLAEPGRRPAIRANDSCAPLNRTMHR